MKTIAQIRDDEEVPIPSVASAGDEDSKDTGCDVSVPPTTAQTDSTAALMRAFKIARGLTVFMTIALLVVWPMPMYGSGYIISKKFFTGWVVVGIIWILISLIVVGIYPIWEGRFALARYS
ncbi:hypothetical protein V1525DRAFT_458837 [Lipomyces kononenkoae]|uniref:Uncharacterized protein n=1 Tax=Lipomyces kononenkoae TaxID=34357 RepID=A0ACC3SU04_LIPKO